jgi:hypothetical protein
MLARLSQTLSRARGFLWPPRLGGVPRKPLLRVRFSRLAALMLVVCAWMVGLAIANIVSNFLGTFWTVWFFITAGLSLLAARSLNNRAKGRSRSSRQPKHRTLFQRVKRPSFSPNPPGAFATRASGEIDLILAVTQGAQVALRCPHDSHYLTAAYGKR